ncbi:MULTISPECIES: hypothetical protein [unclassified Neochlamydia]|uniref:LOG family protein n=1 Tax=unclassified Neochlamydia TaxID=2643326 RepID=UPI001BC8EFF0|nr:MULTISPECIES: hypothetical protein [unclassified Neochlamydia]MBS4166550.1 Uncharacterized protein [Neochlamydia sp. AcF65]MBS4171378.1 Uncharacterized protein [Neochlamydia sp. AcF95]
MNSQLFLETKYLDLVTPDGIITHLGPIHENTRIATVFISQIPSLFVGFEIDLNHLFFNIKSTLAQLGVNGIGIEYQLDKQNSCAEVKVHLSALGRVGAEMLKHIEVGAAIGRLFAADERRRVRDPDYLFRMFGRSDRWGRPLLSLGGLHGSDNLILDKVDGRTVAYLSLLKGRGGYASTIHGFLPTVAKALTSSLSMREILKLHQEWELDQPREVNKNELLLVRTLPLHIRTVFGHVAQELLSTEVQHTTASVLQPDTYASGDIYELYGSSQREITDIPLEFYTLEPYREHVYFSDRDQLQACLEDTSVLFEAFKTAPEPIENRAAVFVVKGEQFLNLKPEAWITRTSRFQEFPKWGHGTRKALMVERFIEQQPSYPFLKAIDDSSITSQGILLTRYFPSPFMKRMLLSDQVQRCLKGIYFQYASQSHLGFFSAEDRALLHDLDKFAIPVFWVDETSHKVLQFVQKPGYDSGLFVPLGKIEAFLNSTVFGIYGSNLLEGNFETELRKLLKGVIEMRQEMNHPLLKKDTPLALITGGGPGAMEVGNRVAQEYQMLSCANIVDFRAGPQTVVNEQRQNPYIDAKMTYRLDKLVERQAEFNLDFPIFLEGGIGTDFEYSLEEVRRKVGSVPSNPVLLFGEPAYWKQKITSRFQLNYNTGTIKGSEWITNCFYCIQNAQQGLKVYREFFQNKLKIGKTGPIYEEGFCIVE